MRLHRDDYRNRVLGCWLGKNIGGTLGAPFEWRRQENEITFYTQELGGEPLPNDDLDIQLLWLIALEREGVDLDAHVLADYWSLYVAPHWAEYGIGKVNMRSGLLPPASGTWRNAYRDSCGSFIRTEIWACIAPGLPAVAARYAYEDSILDHGKGEGTCAAVFTAALESAAFVLDDLETLIEIGLSYIPADCGVAQAVRTAVACHRDGLDMHAARDLILERHRGSSHMGNPAFTAPADREKGFATGRQGYDVPSNIAIYVYGLLAGGDDFDKMICTTVNMGEDTDCTGATAGSIWGILHGANAIPQRWIDPIGRGIKTICLNVGDLWGLAKTVDELTDRTERLALQALGRHGGGGMVDPTQPTDRSDVSVDRLRAPDGGGDLWASLDGPRFRFPFFTVDLDYGEAPTIRAGEAKTIRVTIHNNRNIPANLTLRWYLPDGWSVLPAPQGVVQSLGAQFGPPPTVAFALAADRVDQAMNRAILEITVEGRPTVMPIPVTLLNGNLEPA